MPRDYEGPTPTRFSPDCGEIAMERIRYFNGRFLSARDLRDEQHFHLSRHYLHQRLLHGWGVVCGLGVVEHERPDCANRWVVLRRGIAVDCCGHEIVVGNDVAFELPTQEDWDTSQQTRRRELFLCLRYDETEVECVPVLDPDSTCDDFRKENSRIREGWRLDWIWLRREEWEACGWQMGTCDERPEPDDASAEAHEAAGPQAHDRCGGCHEPGCLEPKCPPGHCLLLARVSIDWQQRRLDIDARGRRALPPPADCLTHVCGINWPHGGEVTLGELRRMRQLEIRFDRPLRRPTGDARPKLYGPSGINDATFVVEYGGRREDLDFVPQPKQRSPRVTDGGWSAVYEIDPDADDYDSAYGYLVNHTVFVTIYFDHVPDCHGEPVDGNFFGTFPTGNGMKGGTFRSWFRVVPGRREDEYATSENERRR